MGAAKALFMSRKALVCSSMGPKGLKRLLGGRVWVEGLGFRVQKGL